MSSKVESPRRNRHGSSSRSSHNSENDDATDHHHHDNTDKAASAAAAEQDDDSSSSSSSSIDPVLSLSPIVTKSLRTTASQRGLALPLPKTPERAGSSGSLPVNSNSANVSSAVVANRDEQRATGDGEDKEKSDVDNDVDDNDNDNDNVDKNSNQESSSSRSSSLDVTELPNANDHTDDDKSNNDDDDDDDNDDDVPTVVLPEPTPTDSDPPLALDQTPESASSSSSSLLAAPNVPAPRPAIDNDDLMMASSAFAASEPGELGLVVGDLLHITTRADTGWWLGVKCEDGSKGWLPATHVRSTSTEERERALAALAELKPTSKRRRKKTKAGDSVACDTAVASELAALPAPTTRSPQPPEKNKPMDRARRALNRLSRSFSPHHTATTNANDANSSAPTMSSTSSSSSSPPPPSSSAAAAASSSPTLARSSDSPHAPAGSRKMLGNIKRAIAGKFASDSAASAADIEVSEPRFQEHRSHIGMSKEGKFEWDNVPDQWKSLFTSVTRTRMGNSSREERRPMTMSLDLDDLAAITAAANSSSESGTSGAAATAAAAPSSSTPPPDAEPESRQLAATLAEARRLAALHSTDAADDDESSEL
jgi:hypothetical protein